MKHKLFTLLLLLCATATVTAQDKMEVKDADSNLLMQVNDEGTAGSITLPGLSIAPPVFTNKIYSIGGVLYFNGAPLSSLWSQNGANIFFNTGNVGIGLNNPSTALHVNGTVTATAFVGDGSGLTGIPVAGDNLGNHTATQVLNLNGNYLSGDGDSEGIFVDGNGNVGIGTTMPTNKLDIHEGMIEISHSTDAPALVLVDEIDGDQWSIAHQRSNYRLEFRRKKSGSPFYNFPMVIDSLGNVGMGTLVPNSKLDVIGTVTATAFVGDGSGLTNLPPGNGWSLTGNAGTVDGTNFLGTTDNVALDFRVNNARALRLEYVEDAPGSPAPNVIGGYSGNTVAAGISGATISGGGQGGNVNQVTANWGTVGGGANNVAGGLVSTVAGGAGNKATKAWSVVAGGVGNTASGSLSTVAGGDGNTASGDYSIVLGGFRNNAGGITSLAAGTRAKITHDGTFLFSDGNNFDFNSAAANEFAARATGGVRFVTAVDGSGNPTQTVSIDNTGTVTAAAFIGDGSGLTNLPPGNGWSLTGNAGTVDGTNFIGTTDNVALDFRINNKRGLRLEYADDSGDPAPNIIGGYGGNTVTVGIFGATISGGGKIGFNNTISGSFATIGGGSSNTANGLGAVVSGGQTNSASGHSTVGGGSDNTANGNFSVISGGVGNSTTGFYSTVGGGSSNQALGQNATVAGGGNNIASGSRATVGGGYYNTASGTNATIAGGGGFFEGIIGNTASGYSSTVPGGSLNQADGDYSFAAGRRAKVDAAHDGAFLFADQNNLDFNSTAANEFAARATGGVRFVTAIDGSGNPTRTVSINNNGTVTATAFVGDGSGLTNIPTADNLGNHTVTQPLDMNGNWLTNDANFNNGIFIKTSGDVGIGTANPEAKLDIRPGDDGDPISDPSSITGLNVDISSFSGAGDKFAALFLGGNVGIGTSTPTRARLDIQGQSGSTTLSYGYLDNSGNTGTASATNAYSLYATNRIAAQQFHAHSDMRIKNIKGVSNAGDDLQTLMHIEVTDYTLRDTVANGNTPQKKVIAQQVAKVYPQAVTTDLTEVVPDIYKRADIEDGWVKLATDLQPGERVKLISAEHDDVYEVLAVRAGAFQVDWAHSGEVFVYGREVDDFHTVDYEAISMLNVSATQELYRLIQQQQQEIDALKSQNSAYEERFAQIEVALRKMSDVELTSAENK